MRYCRLTDTLILRATLPNLPLIFSKPLRQLALVHGGTGSLSNLWHSFQPSCEPRFVHNIYDLLTASPVHTVR